jgi:peptidoglycan/LPS O-acetylase OafA/YrhL
MFVNYLLRTLTFVVLIFPPLLSLFLLRRPSFARVLLHVATTIYILWIAYIFTSSITPNFWTYVTSTFLLVYSSAALVAGLPEATAAGRWARGVYCAALLFWLSLVVALLPWPSAARSPSYRHLSSVHHSR